MTITGWIIIGVVAILAVGGILGLASMIKDVAEYFVNKDKSFCYRCGIEKQPGTGLFCDKCDEEWEKREK